MQLIFLKQHTHPAGFLRKTKAAQIYFLLEGVGDDGRRGRRRARRPETGSKSRNDVGSATNSSGADGNFFSSESSV
jgi:hypothetical protein